MLNLPANLNLGKIVVVDTERTCWEGEPPSHPVEISPFEGIVNPPKMTLMVPEQSETIEIGVCLLTVDTLEISKPRRIFIKPTRSTISDFCTGLTGITQEVLDRKGVSRLDAWKILTNEFKLKERVWAGWGWDNVRMNEELCYDGVTPSREGMEFSPSYIDLCGLFSILRRSSKRVGLQEALRLLDKEFKGTHHSAGDDAYNAAVVLREIIETHRFGADCKHIGVTI